MKMKIFWRSIALEGLPNCRYNVKVMFLFSPINQERAKTEVFGEVIQINEPDFIPEVSKAPKGVWVVLHLFVNGSLIETKSIILLQEA